MICRKLFSAFVFTGMISLIPVSIYAQSSRWKEAEIKGDTLLNREDFTAALKYYNKAISLSKGKDREVYRTYYKRAVCLYSLGEYQAALKDLDVFIPEYPTIPQALLLKAFIYRELDDEEAQLLNIDAAMKMQPPSAHLLKWRGLIFLKKDDFQNAIPDLRRARSIQDDAEIETYLGICYYNLDKKDSAFISFNKSIEADATYLPAYLYASSLSLEDANYDRALKYVNLALRLEPKNKEALFYKGVALVESNNLDEGCKCLNRAFYDGMDDAGGYLKEFCYPTED